jgi:ketosteroid isomerase-like protein
MKTLLKFLTFITLVVPPLASSSDQLFSENEVSGMMKKWSEAMGTADVKTLQTLLDDRYIHIHGTSLVESKSQFLEAFSNGSRKYDPITIEDQKIRVFHQAALVNGHFKLKAYTKDRTLEGVNRFTLAMTKTPQGIKIISFQATAIPQPK